MSAANAETVIIYRQVYKHRRRKFTAWSYLDGKNAENSGMRFAFSLEGETFAGLPDRAEAVRKARERIDKRPLSRVKQRQRQTHRRLAKASNCHNRR